MRVRPRQDSLRSRNFFAGDGADELPTGPGWRGRRGQRCLRTVTGFLQQSAKSLPVHNDSWSGIRQYRVQLPCAAGLLILCGTPRRRGSLADTGRALASTEPDQAVGV